MSNVALYIRVSTDEQADRGYSQRDQEERLKRYCETNNLKIDNLIFEDHSAKNFNRPGWNELLIYLKKKKSKIDKVLFTKWDRFSRNAGDAYQMIGILKKLGVEVQAIEQPLDLFIPENKMMLAIYLAAPEVENDRRALNTFYGMRRAKKEGRWMASAPFGYINKITEDGKYKFIEPKEPEASIIRYLFNEIAKGIEAPETIRRQLSEKGVKILSNQAFHVAIRNPVYCGKIFIKKYRDEEAHYVKSLHAPLISETLFNKVQLILEGNKRKTRKYIKFSSADIFPLRGFLICPKCGKNLTASGSKGSQKVYYYYHCKSFCGFRQSAELTNNLFVEELKKYEFLPSVQKILQNILLTAYKKYNNKAGDRRKRIISEIETYNAKIALARDKLLAEKIEDDDYMIIKAQSKQKIEILENELHSCLVATRNPEKVDDRLNKALSVISNLSLLYQSSSVEAKRKIISSIYPENLEFTGIEYRTTRVNSVLRSISLVTNGLGSINNKKNDQKTANPCLVAPPRIELGSKV
ncbi:recombinase family protein [Chryseobacterium sp. G0162]|uniref:recombinase family protein n=1 Tax=Chryseobacterium sp. G0162 TaxID=2487063 RepID=UPI000F4E86A5|nr:recombinase family protein [Chryseobacterium sp. G0162]